MMYFKCLKQIFKRGLISAAILLLTAAATSCSNDDIEETRGPGWIPDGNYLVSFKITTPDGIGIHPDPDNLENVGNGDLVYGNDGEHAIGDDRNFVIFFRGANKIVYDVQELKLDNYRLSQDAEPNIEYYYSAQIKIASTAEEVENLEKDAENLQFSCIVVLNAGPMSHYIMNDLKGKTPAQVREGLIWEDRENPCSIGRDGTYFTMSNSLYVIGDQEHFDVTIPKEAIYYDPDIPGELVRIQVERLVAKVNFEFAPSGEAQMDNNYIFRKKGNEDYIIPYCDEVKEVGDAGLTDYAPVTKEKHWRAKVTGWDMNALECKEFLYKKINANGRHSESKNPYFQGWNDAPNYRTYWAEDPNYAGTYPWQYRLAVNKELPYYKENADTSAQVIKIGSNTLYNYSYTQLNNSDFNRIVYIPENTYDYAAINDIHDRRTDLLAGSHLLVTAELLTDFVDNTFKANDCYRDRTGIYYTDLKLLLWTLVRAFNYELNSQTMMEFTTYNWDSQTDDKNKRYVLSHNKKYKLYLNNEELTYSKIKYMDDNEVKKFFVPATILDGDGKVMIWREDLRIQNESGDEPKIYKKIDIKYENGEIVYVPDGGEDPVVDYRKSFYLEWMGAIDHFKDGKMYYAAPAKINGNTCGTVRNSWYQFKLENITGVGTPVDNPEEPIVPDIIKTDDQVNITVNIIGWHNRDIWIPVL